MPHIELKRIKVTRGPLQNPLVDQVQLNGVSPEERLTPKLARRAILAAGGHCFPATAWDQDFDYGYRVYVNSARKLGPQP